MLVNDNQMVRRPDQMVVIEPRPPFIAVQCVIEVVLQGEGSKMPAALARLILRPVLHSLQNHFSKNRV